MDSTNKKIKAFDFFFKPRGQFLHQISLTRVFLFAEKPFWSPVARYRKLHCESVILKMKISLFFQMAVILAQIIVLGFFVCSHGRIRFFY